MSYENKGVFVPTTFTFNLLEIDSSNIKFEEFLRKLSSNLNNIATALNLKDTGVYSADEFVCGKTYFANTTLRSTSASAAAPRQVFRKVVDFGALPNATSKSVAHGLTMTASTIITDIYGGATDPSGNNYIPLPYSSPTLNNNIELRGDGTNVIITTGIDRTAFTTTYVVLEYLKF